MSFFIEFLLVFEIWSILYYLLKFIYLLKCIYNVTDIIRILSFSPDENFILAVQEECGSRQNNMMMLFLCIVFFLSEIGSTLFCIIWSMYIAT